MSSNNRIVWYKSAEHALALKLTIIIEGVLIAIILVGFFVGSGFEGQQEAGFFQDRMRLIERAGNINELIEQEKNIPILGNPEKENKGPRRERIGLRNVIVINENGKKTVFGFLANTPFNLPNIQPQTSKLLSVDGNNVIFYSFETQGKKLYFYENVDLLNHLRTNVFFGSMAALLFFGLALYFIALWIAKKTIEPIRKSEEYARSYNHHIAHELKTPLAIIRSDLELALKSPQDVSSYIGSAVEEVGLMRKSIDNLLFLAEREAKKSPEPIVLEKEVTSVMEDLDKIYAKKKITFKITSVQDLHILADSGLVKVLLRNILENIYKYAEPNTEAKISFSKKQLIFSNISEESFSQGRIDGAFTPFVGTPGNGHGLGLSIVRRICDIHGWKIEASGGDKSFEIKINL